MSSALFLVSQLVILTSTVTLVLSQLENMASPNDRENIFQDVSISSNKFSSAFYSVSEIKPLHINVGVFGIEII